MVRRTTVQKWIFLQGVMENCYANLRYALQAEFADISITIHHAKL